MISADPATVIRQNVHHLARGARSSLAHSETTSYEAAIGAAVESLLVEHAALQKGLRQELDALHEHEEWLERSIAAGATSNAWERRLLASLQRIRALADGAPQ